MTYRSLRRFRRHGAAGVLRQHRYVPGIPALHGVLEVKQPNLTALQPEQVLGMKIAQGQPARKGHGLLDQRIALRFPARPHLALKRAATSLLRQPVGIKVCIGRQGEPVKFQDGPDLASDFQMQRHRKRVDLGQHIGRRHIGLGFSHQPAFDLAGNFPAIAEILD